MRGETTQLAEIAMEALGLAREFEDKSAEASARFLEGVVWQARGKLEAARAAFDESMAIGRRLAPQDPSNAGWQRELGAALSRVGDVLQAQGKLEAARAAFDEYLAISRRLAEQDPSNAGWQQNLAVANSKVGDVLQAEGKLEAARAAFDESVAIGRRLAHQDPNRPHP
jgi:tetratricopeptide (TPR) repeat protein